MPMCRFLTQNIPTLSLEGLAGDDTFTLTTDPSGPTRTRTLNLDGGATSVPGQRAIRAILTAAASSRPERQRTRRSRQGGKDGGPATSLQKINLNGGGPTT